MSFKDFANYLMAFKGVDFDEVIVPKMMKAVKDTYAAFWSELSDGTTS